MKLRVRSDKNEKKAKGQESRISYYIPVVAIVYYIKGLHFSCWSVLGRARALRLPALRCLPSLQA